MSPQPAQVCIACSIFRMEIRRLQEEARLELPVRFLGSMLHMVPEQLETQLHALVEEERAQGREVVLAFGDCCPDMTGLASAEGMARTQGCNCPEIILGREAYRSLRRQGVFFLLPEWTLTWRKVFQGTLGLTGETARDFMGEMHTRLLYLDTGDITINLPKRPKLIRWYADGDPVELTPETTSFTVPTGVKYTEIVW